ncbi:hypothetical protein ACFQ48_11015 [Hymenobacter caeli]|uniref:Lipoprotein n=1 Tax=Hymenobacter caeli TaxID=2735894 RepID=A0ABX2FU00_9BACT|nr:hypothetical protein [Hymenobacter caeli]NRT19907.1 hypothetical protein [Hymenobacter caeli]
MKKSHCFFASAVASAALLGGCAVYVPTVPSTPLLRNKGDVEVTAAVGNPNTLETSVAWVPLPHLLVTGEAALRASSDSQTRNNVTTTHESRHRQGGLGIGTYQLLGKNKATYLGAIGGVGFATADLYYPSLVVAFILPLPGPDVHYEASYRRYYGQVYAAHLAARHSYGLSVRGTWVDYRSLVLAGKPVALRNQFFLEPTVFMRAALGRGAFQVLGAVGCSAPVHKNFQRDDNENLAPFTTLCNLGIAVDPNRLFRRKAAVPQP